MKRKFLLIAFLAFAFLFVSKIYGQSLPVGSCGVVYTYDASGNRTQRQYLCNNGLMAAAIVDSDQIQINDVTEVNALFPNPTTGIFSIKLTQPLNNILVTIADISGSIIINRKETGIQLTYDLSNYPSGEYIITINQKPKKISMKVIKSK